MMVDAPVRQGSPFMPSPRRRGGPVLRRPSDAGRSGDMVAILGTYGFGTLTAATFPIFIIGLLWMLLNCPE